MKINFENTYIDLGGKFYTRIYPTKVENPELVCFNDLLATELGTNFRSLNAKEIAEIFSGNKILEGSDPAALVYAGHQFGHFVPQLGDGRAILLGELMDKKGERRDIQLKGSGQTPYSRRGDGRAALGPMIREYIVSEAMHSLNISTTRSLAIVKTGELVLRGELQPGAILTRIAASHLRVGTFEYFASQGDFVSLKKLADYAIRRHYPQAEKTPNPYLTFFKLVVDAQTSLVADWVRVGFIHGVMNTDNVAISGETIDYGPCAFMDNYHHDKVLSSIDYHGRYAFGNQANMCIWNLVRFGQSIGSLISPNFEIDIQFIERILDQKWLRTMGQKLGIINSQNEDRQLIQDLLDIMQEDEADYTLTFRYLSYASNNNTWPYYQFFTPSNNLKDWINRWIVRLRVQSISMEEVNHFMLSIGPALVPRNHLIENVISLAVKENDFSEMHKLLHILLNPYKEQTGFANYMKPPQPEERILQTFCGT